MNEKENKQPETAADILAAIKTEEAVPPVLAYEICKRIEATLKDFCKGLAGDRALQDFRNHDIGFFFEAKPSDFPILYSYNEYGTNAYSPSFCGKNLFRYIWERYSVAKHGTARYIKRFKEATRISSTPCSYLCINYENEMLTVRSVTIEQADNICKDAYIPWYEKYKALVGLPTDLRMRVQFRNISLGKLKELLSDPTPLPQRWPDSPKTVGESLLSIFRRIHNYDKAFSDHKYVIGYDGLEDGSIGAFYFNEYNPTRTYALSGAIVYHGSSSEGYRENGSVMIDPQYGWSMHT